MSMLNEIMTLINNHFIRTAESAKYTISGDVLSGALSEQYWVGQYVWIRGSVLHDDVYKVLVVGDNSLTLDMTDPTGDETETFTVYGLSVPKDFLRVAEEIKAYAESHQGADGVTSETIGKYSVSYKNGSGWSEAFRTKLNQYRRIYDRGILKENYNWQNRMWP